MTFWGGQKPPKPSVRGGDPNCVHHFIFGRPEYMRGTKFMRERGVCKKCGAVQELLRAAYSNWKGEDVLLISDEPVLKGIVVDKDDEYEE